MYKFLEEKWAFHPLLKCLLALLLILVIILSSPIGIGVILVLSMIVFHRKKRKKSEIGTILTILLLVIHSFCGNLGFLVILLTIFWYLQVIIITSTKSDFFYFYEKSFYNKKYGRYSSFVLPLVYGIPYFKEEYLFLNQRRLALGSRFTFRNFTYHLQEAYERTVYRLKKIETVYRIRLYQIRNKRTYIDDYCWTVDDNTYLMIHCLLIIICLFS